MHGIYREKAIRISDMEVISKQALRYDPRLPISF